MTKDEALKLALAAIESEGWCDTEVVITAIKEALAAPQSLPDALTYEWDSPDYVEGWNECREVMAGMMK